MSLLHVVEDPFVTGAWQSEAFAPHIPELLNSLIKTAEGHLHDLKRDLAAHGYVVETVVISGKPSNAIIEYAATGQFDMIVMGTHGRTGLSHALLGSVAQRVVQRAPCAVLTIRETAPADTRDAAMAGAVKANR